MFSPGKKNWLKKFFSLVKHGEINLTVALHQEEHDKDELIREVCEHTGILYGVPNQQLYTDHYVVSATRNERLQVLLFESLLFIDRLHQKDEFSATSFLDRLTAFYQIPTEQIKRTWYSPLSTTDDIQRIENLLSDRIKVHSSYSDKNFWFNHLTNGFLYLDVILYHRSFTTGKKKEEESYNAWVESVLLVISTFEKRHSDTRQYFDQSMFRNLLLSSALSEDRIKSLKQGEPSEKQFETALAVIGSEPMLALFTFHFLIFIYHSYPSDQFTTGSFIYHLAQPLGITQEKTAEIFWECRKSMSDHSSEFYHLVSESESKILTTHLSRKYYRILGRNKDRLVQELKESKELVYLVRQSTLRELTPEEKEKVKTQSMDLMKSVPSIGIYLIPGGALWLPLVLKLIPDLLPSAFKENEVEEKK